ncbi:hypothetical protein HpBT170_03770 [Helicobacter pylori]
MLKIKFDCASGSGYSAESIKGYKERILGVAKMKHGTNFVDVSVPYHGYKLSLHLARIEDMGEFTLFCLRAFGDGLSLSDLSHVTAIDRMIIQKKT